MLFAGIEEFDLLFCKMALIWGQGIEAGDNAFARLFQGVAVENSGQAAHRNHHRFQAVGQNVRAIVQKDILGLLLNELLVFQDCAIRYIPLLERCAHKIRKWTDEDIVLGIKDLLLCDLDIGFVTLVEDRQGGTIDLGLPNSVPIDIVAKDISGLLPWSSNNGRTGKGNPSAVGKHPAQIGMELSSLGAVALIYDHKYSFIWIDHFF